MIIDTTIAYCNTVLLRFFDFSFHRANFQKFKWNIFLIALQSFIVAIKNSYLIMLYWLEIKEIFTKREICDWIKICEIFTQSKTLFKLEPFSLLKIYERVWF